MLLLLPTVARAAAAPRGGETGGGDTTGDTPGATVVALNLVCLVEVKLLSSSITCIHQLPRSFRGLSPNKI